MPTIFVDANDLPRVTEALGHHRFRIVGESVQEFIARHGGDAIEIVTEVGGETRRSGMLVLPDGARIDNEDGRHREEPPADPAANLAARIKYVEMKLLREQARLRNTQTYISTQAMYHSKGCGPLPDPGAFGDLEKLKASIGEIEAQLATMRSELHALRGPSHAERYDRQRNEQRAAAQDAVDRMISMIQE